MDLASKVSVTLLVDLLLALVDLLLALALVLAFGSSNFFSSFPQYF